LLPCRRTDRTSGASPHTLSPATLACRWSGDNDQGTSDPAMRGWAKGADWRRILRRPPPTPCYSRPGRTVARQFRDSLLYQVPLIRTHGPSGAGRWT
jgi:hypothetical protein